MFDNYVTLKWVGVRVEPCKSVDKDAFSVHFFWLLSRRQTSPPEMGLLTVRFPTRESLLSLDPMNGSGLSRDVWGVWVNY